MTERHHVQCIEYLRFHYYNMVNVSAFGLLVSESAIRSVVNASDLILLIKYMNNYSSQNCNY